MKTFKSLGLMLITILAITACSTTSNIDKNSTKSVSGRDYSSYTNLADILRQQLGVTVTGSGNTAKVQIRGLNTIKLDPRPLYVYDGIELGRDYAQANAAINLAEIRSVRIIRDLNQLNFYGERGRNGVIYIRSKKSRK
jgi:TonB-dependent receptor-like protein